MTSDEYHKLTRVFRVIQIVRESLGEQEDDASLRRYRLLLTQEAILAGLLAGHAMEHGD